jgi:predicted metal-dependent phosphoesterase TrpH
MKSGVWVDMHTHTSASDGDLGPAELVEAALRQGLGAVAVTDHDTVGGVPEALARGKGICFHVIPGVELAVEAKNGQTFHLLGYNFDMKYDELCTTLARLQRARSDRNDRLMARLAKLGLPLDPETLSKCAKGGQIGRPHFAKAMVELGYVRSPDEAFLRYLRKGALAYVEKFRLAPETAIGLIRRAGGVPAMAHPHPLGFESPLELEAYVAR